MQTQTVPKSLPAPIRRFSPRETLVETLVLKLQTVTPVVGGSSMPRHVDPLDRIRVPAIRGQLRFWWRALYGPAYLSKGGNALQQAEADLWGWAGGKDGDNQNPHDKSQTKGKASRVRIAVELTSEANKDIEVGKDSAGYVLWPLREEKGQGRGKTPAGEYLESGIRFCLTVTCSAKVPQRQRNFLQEVTNTLKAWILFGGYGARTRRGAGSLTLRGVKEGDQENFSKPDHRWLPTWNGDSQAFLTTINGLFEDIRPFDKVKDYTATDMPVLADAGLCAAASPCSKDAWHDAIAWLQAFRQGSRHEPYARNPGSTQNKPGLSNWPEADKLRHLNGVTTRKEGPLRHNEKIVWHRAALGLPIANTNRDSEPGPFELGWCAPPPPNKPNSQPVCHDRLASPLIIKLLPLIDGQFLPCALWLNRAYPDGQVAKMQRTGKKVSGN
jgi:CRISPR-associated protein Cmr1